MILLFNFKKTATPRPQKTTLDPVAWDPPMEHFKFETNSSNA